MEKANAVVLYVLQASLFHKSVEISAFWQRYRSIRIGHIFHGAFRWLFFYNQKSFVRRRLRHCRLRHKIHAIKARPNNPLRFLQHKNSISRYLANDLTCAARKTTFRTQKRFHNKQYTPKSKDQPLESDRTHFYVRFNKSNVAMHPNLYFSSFSQNHNRSIKSNQPEQSIKSNNQKKQSPQPFNQKQPKNKHEKLSHQSIVKSITQTITTNNQKSLNQNHTQNKPLKQPQQPITPYTKIFEY